MLFRSDKDIAVAPDSFAMPDGVERDTICVETKKLATQYCPQRMAEVFNKNYVPGKCQKHTSWHSQEGEEPKNTINF